VSKLIRKPLAIPAGVAVVQQGGSIEVKGDKGRLHHHVHPLVEVKVGETAIDVAFRNRSKPARAMAGTTYALLRNLLLGVSRGFEKRLVMTGVGYRAQLAGDTLSLSLGFSHPVAFAVPADLAVEVPSQNEVVVRGIDKQRVGWFAASIRAQRPPEPYKGKGVAYAGEIIRRKLGRKKLSGGKG